ncbi:MAG TPA: DUF1223 domain-containing protein [Aestuariivirga sp.]|jgi:hypothetical protein|nr:DUF1223 domain-containing protein [Aestuariivirga sp.]HRA93097.1 DUF1223 domain-containing protein [Aestuariivirga sp.]
MTCLLTRRNALALGAAAVLARPALAAVKRPVIVELFTSQGCSSCPPADAYFKALKDQPDVVALSYHVDYWDYLGWRDTLGSPECSQRQYDYAKSRGDKNVYTPQTIINGGGHFVGSQRARVSSGIDVARSETETNWVDMEMTHNNTDISISIPAGKPISEATLWLMAFTPHVSTEIKKGENAGHTVDYFNVVRKMVPAGMWHGEAAKIVLPKGSVVPESCKGWVALLQEGTVGRVIGAVTGGASPNA